MKKLIFLAPLLLAACATPYQTGGAVVASGADAVGLPPPHAHAQHTTLDEKAAIGLERAYTLAAKATAITIRAGLIKDRDLLQRISDLNDKAYDALRITRSAYASGNAASYAQAFANALEAIDAINALLGGPNA